MFVRVRRALRQSTAAKARGRRAGPRRSTGTRRAAALGSAAALITAGLSATMLSPTATAQADDPQMLHPRLAVQTVATGLVTPTSLAFLGADDLLVLEKNTGRVQRVVNDAVQSTALDLAVNFGSERGLLGIALHPDFPTNPGVYLYWTESSTAEDTAVLSQTPLLGNRVDRFVWDGSALSFDQNL